jgi:hypothetical protein
MKRKTRAKNHALQMIDLNLLPEVYRKRKITLSALRPWLFLLAFGLILIPTLQLYSKASLELNRVEGDLAQVQAALDDYRPLAEEKAALEAKIEEALDQAGEIESATDSATIQEIVWSDVLQNILRIAPAGIELTIIDQLGYEVVIVGVAEGHHLPMSYADDLMESGLFASLVVNSIVQIKEAEPTSIEPAGPVSPALYEFEMSLILPGQAETP